MTRLYLLFILLLPALLQAQNKDTTQVSITNYRLVEGSTFSWRGTNTFSDRTAWDSSPYTEGHLQQLNRANWEYRMNYRLLFPVGHNKTYSPGYPIVVMLHGAGERGNCWDDNCHYGTTSYNPNRVPEGATEDQLSWLLNNDHNLLHGGRQYLDARNRAGTKLPNDRTLNARAFPGFVLFPQMLNNYGNDNATNSDITHVIRIVRLLVKRYNIDPDRIYFHGLSLGGQGVLKALKVADWLVAAATTMSPINYQNTMEYDSTATIPLWIFQGGQDTNPTPFQTESLIRRFREAGGSARYTFYENLGHGTWNTAWREPDFFSWFLSKNKANIHVYFESPFVCASNGQGAKLGLAEGFPAYQWERDGQIIPGATGAVYMATQPGVYRARFSRISTNPTAAQWNRWSDPVTIAEKVPPPPVLEQVGSVVLRDLNGNNTARLKAPEGFDNYVWLKDGVPTTLPNAASVSIASGDCTGPCTNAGAYTVTTSGFDQCPSAPSNAKYISFNNQSPVTIPTPTGLKASILSTGDVLLQWNDVSALERGYEIWRRRSTDNANTGWTFVTLTAEDITSYNDQGLLPGTEYWYKIRAVSNSARSAYAPGESKTLPAENLIITTGGDTTPPAPPQNLTAVLYDTDVNSRTSTVELKWQAAADDSNVREYQIAYGNQTVLTGSKATMFRLSGLGLNTNFAFTVRAVDFGNNLSAPSSQAVANTFIEGLFYRHSTGAYTDLNAVPQQVWANPEFRGRVQNFRLNVATQQDFYVIRYYGYFMIQTAGTYRFQTRANDGARLLVDGVEMTSKPTTAADGSCITTTGAEVNLTAGVHAIDLYFFENSGTQCLNVRYSGPDSGAGATARFINIPDGRLKSFDSYTPPLLPAVPEDLTATSAGLQQINLSWAYNGEAVAEFEIYRGESPTGPFTVINRVSTLAYEDKGLTPGKTYYYRIRAVNEGGSSAFTPVVNATTESDTQAPTAPANLVASAPTFNSVTLQWEASTDNTGVTGYEIWVNGAVAATTEVNYYLLQNLQPDASYAVYVVAFDANKNKSLPSNTINVGTKPPGTYYSKATGNLNDINTWGQQTDGSGDTPGSFQTNGSSFVIANRNATSPGGPWKVEGSSSEIVVSAGVTLTLDQPVEGRLKVRDNGMVIFAHATGPKLEELSAQSTVQYNAPVVNIQQASYGNLILSGTGEKVFAEGTTTVTGNLTAAAGISLKGSAGNKSRLDLRGDLTMAGSPGETLPDFGVHLDISGKSVHRIDVGAGTLDLFFLTTAPSSRLEFVSGSRARIRAGSPAGGGLRIANGSEFLLGRNQLEVSGAGAINSANETGVIAVRNGSIDILTSGNQNSNLYFNPAADTASYLRVNASGRGRIFINAPLKISDSLKVAGGEINTRGNITLLSTAAKTANLSEIEGNGRITGRITVQRYVSLKARVYRYISTPVSGTRVADWQKFFAITGPFSGASTGGTLTRNPSLFYYQEPQGWLPYPSPDYPAPYKTNTAPIERGKGYSAFIRNTTPFTMEVSGNPFQGPVPFQMTPIIPDSVESGWNLLGNPYASVIRWSNDPAEWTRNGVNSIVAVRDNATVSNGKFLYYDAATGTGTGDILEGGRIAAGQAFWVRAISAQPELIIYEKAKSPAQQELFRASAAEPLYSHIKINVQRDGKADQAVVVFTPFGSDGFDEAYDGEKRNNEGVFNLSTLSADGKPLAINNMAENFCAVTVALNVTHAPAGSYNLSVDSKDLFEGVGKITLADNYTGQTTEVRDGENIAFQITADPASAGSGRFTLTLERNMPAAPQLTASVCTESPVVLLNGVEKGVRYSIEGTDTGVTANENGTLSLPVHKLIREGNNTFEVRATRSTCQGMSVTTTLQVDYYNPAAGVPIDLTVCNGSTASLKAEDNPHAVGYEWHNEAGTVLKGNASATFETPEITTETVFTNSPLFANGCKGEKQFMTVHPVQLETPELYVSGDTLYTTSTGKREYQWFRNGVPETRTSDPFLPLVWSGAYTVTVSAGDCQKTSSEFTYEGLDENRINMWISPNPGSSANVRVFILSREDSPVTIQVTDMAGRSVSEHVYAADAIPASGIPLGGNVKAGVYLLRAEQGGKRGMLRFIIQD